MNKAEEPSKVILGRGSVTAKAGGMYILGGRQGAFPNDWSPLGNLGGESKVRGGV